MVEVPKLEKQYQLQIEEDKRFHEESENQRVRERWSFAFITSLRGGCFFRYPKQLRSMKKLSNYNHDSIKWRKRGKCFSRS